tara:strand:+ start:1434 stop:2879 length:1446 start_codon:yes stop_codon:yes gene_type:complete
MIGIVVGEATRASVSVMTESALPTGIFLEIIDVENKLGVVEKTVIESRSMDAVSSFDDASSARKIPGMNPRDTKFISIVKILGEIDELKRGVANVPEIPIRPGTGVKFADTEVLKTIFSPTQEEYAQIATLKGSVDVPVKINLDRMISRHSAILSMTGQGKSTLVAAKLIEIAKKAGTAVVYDIHGEMSSLKIKNLQTLIPVINPMYLNGDELCEILEIRTDASLQRDCLRNAFHRTAKGNGKGKEFWSRLKSNLMGEPDQITKVSNKIDNAVRYSSAIINPNVGNPLYRLKEGVINILDMSGLTEKQAKIVVSFYANRLFQDRKKAMKSKELAILKEAHLQVLEEAHVFCDGTKSKTERIFSKIVREGRKMGLGFLLVSQRVRNLSPDILSQISSWSVGKLINQSDLDVIENASEFVSPEIKEQIKYLNVGEFLLAGEFVSISAIVRTTYIEKAIGNDQSIVSQWRKHSEESLQKIKDDS